MPGGILWTAGDIISRFQSSSNFPFSEFYQSHVLLAPARDGPLSKPEAPDWLERRERSRVNLRGREPFQSFSLSEKPVRLRTQVFCIGTIFPVHFLDEIVGCILSISFIYFPILSLLKESNIDPIRL